MHYNFLLFIIFLFFSACSTKQYEKSRSATIVFKTDSLRFYDVGFIKQTKNTTDVELFEVGQVVLKIEMKDDICINSLCYNDDKFYKEYFKKNYPQSTLKNIFMGKDIFDGKNKTRNENGFTQKIESIFYSVSSKQILFKDKPILIKIKNLDY